MAAAPPCLWGDDFPNGCCPLLHLGALTYLQPVLQPEACFQEVVPALCHSSNGQLKAWLSR